LSDKTLLHQRLAAAQTGLGAAELRVRLAQGLRCQR
jgi:hypothetical protein